MLHTHVTKKGKCAFCGSSVAKCEEPSCEQYFHPSKQGHKYCTARCRMRKFRSTKLEN